MEKKERIANLAARWESTATTISGLRRYLATHGIPATDGEISTQGVNAYGRSRLSYESGKILSEKILISIAQRVARFENQEYASTAAGAWRRSKHADWRAHVSCDLGWLSYAGSYRGYSLQWADPGVYAIPLPGGDAEIHVCDYDGQIRSRVVVRGRHLSRITLDGLLPADIYGVYHRKSIVHRYDSAGKKTGLAVLTGDTWEHGKNLAEIRAEIAYKHRLTRVANPTPRQSRAARKILARCHRLVLQRSTARAAGYCNAGIDSWLQSISRLGCNDIVVRDIPDNADKRWLVVARQRAIEIAVERF